MKKLYVKPEIEMTVLSSTDVITLSGGEGQISSANIVKIESSAIDF